MAGLHDGNIFITMGGNGGRGRHATLSSLTSWCVLTHRFRCIGRQVSMMCRRPYRTCTVMPCPAGAYGCYLSHYWRLCVNVQVVQQIVEAFDTDGDGGVNYHE